MNVFGDAAFFKLNLSKLISPQGISGKYPCRAPEELGVECYDKGRNSI